MRPQPVPIESGPWPAPGRGFTLADILGCAAILGLCILLAILGMCI